MKRERDFQGWVQISVGCNCRLLVLHRPVHPRARGVAPGRRAGRGDRAPGRRRRARGHPAGPERELLRPRPAQGREDHASPSCWRWSTAVEGIDRVRYTSPHPKDMKEDVLRAHAELPSVCEHIHLPLQSGSSRVLKAMRRTYNRERYLDRVAHDPRAGARLRDHHRHHRRLPRRDRGRVRGDDGGGGGGALRLGVHVHLLARAGAPRPPSCRTAARTRSSARGWSDWWSRCSGIATERSQRFVGRTMEVLVEGPSRTDPDRLRGRIRHNKTVNFTGVAPAGGDDRGGDRVGHQHHARGLGAPRLRAGGLTLLALFGPDRRGQDRRRARAGRSAARAGRGPGGDLGRRAPGLRGPRGAHGRGDRAAARAPARGRHPRHARRFDLGQYMPLAHAEIDAALAAGRRPIVVGGTGLYLRAALTDLELRPPPPRGCGRASRPAGDGGGGGAARRPGRARAGSRRGGPGERPNAGWCGPWSCWRWGRSPRPRRRLAAVDRAPAPPDGPLRPDHGSRRALRARSTGAWRRSSRPGPRTRCGPPTRPARRTARKALGFDELLAGDVEAMKQRSRNYARRQLTWMRRRSPGSGDRRDRARAGRPGARSDARGCPEPVACAAGKEGSDPYRGPRPGSDDRAALCSLRPPRRPTTPTPRATSSRPASTAASRSCPRADDQALMYDGLTPLFNRVGPATSSRYFKSEALGTAGQGAADERAGARPPGPEDHARRVQRAAHRGRDQRRRDVRRRLGDRQGPRPAARAGALQLARRRGRRSRARCARD